MAWLQLCGRLPLGIDRGLRETGSAWGGKSTTNTQRTSPDASLDHSISRELSTSEQQVAVTQPCQNKLQQHTNQFSNSRQFCPKFTITASRQTVQTFSSQKLRSITATDNSIWAIKQTTLLNRSASSNLHFSKICANVSLLKDLYLSWL